MGYITKNRAAELLNVPVNFLEKLGIIPEYHTAVIEEMAAEHRLPIGEWSHAIAWSDTDVGNDRIHCYPTLEECLLRVNKYTTTLVMPECSEELFNILKSEVFVFCFGDGFCHQSFDDLQGAICQIMNSQSEH